MEHYSITHYLMWKLRSKFPSSMNSFISPWEEQKSTVFQEPCGGFMWPPRSYTCSFCRREFRSAQALGGHMNVHRQDRARLKQSSPPKQIEIESVFCHQKHASDSSYQEPVPQETWQVPPTIFTPFMNCKGISTDTKKGRSGKPGSRNDECNNDEDFVETKLSMGINHLLDHGNITSKRRKKSSNVSSPFPFVSKLCSSDRCSSSPTSMDDIDLELRLGDSPVVK